MGKTVLVMFSGGLDSVAVLHNILTNTRYAYYGVHAHHVHIRNIEKRDKAEDIAVNNVYKWLRTNNYREFTTTESSIEFPTYNNSFLWDSDITSFMAGYITRYSPDISHVAIGMTKSDDMSNSVKNKRSSDIYGAFTNIEKIYPLQDLTKKEIWDSLPDGLRKLAWSCRAPKEVNGKFLVCGSCKTCNQLEFIRNI